MYAMISSQGKTIALTMTAILFFIAAGKTVKSARTKRTCYFLFIIILLAMRVIFSSAPYFSFLLIVILIYLTGKFHYPVKIAQEELIWRLCNTTIFLFSLLSGITGLYRHHFFYLFEICITVFYAGFQLLFLKKKLRIQYGTLQVLLWSGIMIYSCVSAYDLAAAALNYRVNNLVIWITICITLYLMYLVLFKTQSVFPGDRGKRENLRPADSGLTDTEGLLILQDKLVKVGALATGIIHELKNIFFAISTSVDLAFNRRDAEIRNQCLHLIRESAEKGKLFTETVLKRIKLEDTRKERLHLAGEFQKLLTIVKANYRSEGIVFSSDVQADLYIYAGKIDFEQIVLNLISNSVNALYPYPAEEKRILLSAAQTEDKIIIDIIDNGPGVPPELEFEMFKPDVSGNTSTGLGLYIADLLAKRNNGMLAYYPLDQGSDFRLIFDKPEPEI